MTRIILGTVLSLAALSSTAMAQQFPSNCIDTPDKYQLNNMNQLPAPVSSALQKAVPGIKPNKTDCQLAEGTRCFYTGAQYGNHWATIVAVNGKNARRGFYVFMYEKGMPAAEQLNMNNQGISLCTLNRLAGNPPPPKPSLRQRPSNAGAPAKPVGKPQ